MKKENISYHKHEGKLVRGEHNEWVVRSGEHTYQLHPDDFEDMLQDQRRFDNLDARIATWPDVAFHIVQHQKLTGLATYAKLIKS